MIRINLIPYRAARKKEIITRQLTIGALPLIATLLIIGLFWWSINGKNAQAAEDIRVIKAKIEESKLKMKDIDKFKEQKATLAKKMDVIKTLEKNKSGPVRMLDQIASCLPGNIWLTQIEQKDKTLTMVGRTSDNISISRYMLNLEASPNFQDVTLGEIKTDKRRIGSSSLLLKTFRLSSKVTYTPQSEPPPAR